MSVKKDAKRRGNILDVIMKHHRERLPKLMRDVSLADLRALAAVAPPPVDFLTPLRAPGISIIAECKRASPSKGLITRNYDPVRLANTYVQAGASAVSVLTDGRFFQGSPAHLRDVRESLLDVTSPLTGHPVPVLRKDFHFHPYHVYEARAIGADAILLIAAVLDDGHLRSLIALAHELGMAALVEVQTPEEVERVLAIGPLVIGINNRNLRTFAVDIDNTSRLREMIPKEVITVAESGLKTSDDVRSMTKIGVDAVLVGEALVRSRNTFAITREFVEAGHYS